VPDNVTVQVRARGDDVRVDGVARPDGTFTVGPEGAPDVIVDARVGHGDIEVDHWAVGPPTIDLVDPSPLDLPPPPAGPLREVADGVAVARDGAVVLAGGEAIIDADGRVTVGDGHPEGNVTVITTTYGDYRLLPGDLLLTPAGELLELATLRGSVTT